ncbi:MAG: formate dehydrogenase accessory sulfurtransferase FdhD [Anaerosomatales bacterium]|nr:formate dehydrogenase accessory sulfurtransferase FdhD [Anaerosomatales bacterium]MDT8434108.1 formate dehydrogenase accessory sulfurtransferase FdhD [Anaerosomatales bacterium]
MAEDRIPCTAAVLAGGRSMRMGVDKTLLEVDGVPLVARVVESVTRVCAHTFVVTNRPESLDGIDLADEVTVLTDEVPYQGPLGGLVTALKEAPDEWVLAVAADMPYLSEAVVQALWDARDGADAVMPVTPEGPEPLLALYSRACLPAARRVLATGRRRLVAIFSEINAVEVPIESLRSVDPELRSFLNVNTPEELAEAREETVALPVEREATERVSVSVIEVGTRRSRGMPSEHPVTVHMNDVEVATIQATPEDLEEMAAGFLVAEGLMVNRDDLVSIDVDHKRGLVYVSTLEEVPDDMVYKTRYVTSGCGKGITFSSVGHARGLDHIETHLRLDSQVVYDLMGQMARAATAYRDTGGMHACGLARDGELLFVREDVGRHNALDKLLGRAWLDRVPTRDAILLSTGRISYEMAVKAAKAGVPVVVSRTAVTDLAAEIAGELGITLAGYARGGKITVYTHPGRITTDTTDEDAE